MKSFKVEFDRRNVSIVVVSFAELSKLLLYQKQHQWPFTVLADPQRNAYRAFNLKSLSWFQVFSAATLLSYWKFFREGMKRQNYGKEDVHQSGGDFLLDREGNILFAHRSQDPADRPSVPALLREIDHLAQQRAQSATRTKPNQEKKDLSLGSK